MENIFQFIGKAFLTLSVFVAGIFGIGTNLEAPVENVGASIPVSVAVFQTSLQTSISATATEMTLVSGTDKAGNALAGYMCFNLDEGTAKEEFVCGTVAGTAVTSMIRGIDPIDGDLEVTALKKAHSRGGSVKITNYPSLGIVSRILNGNETIPNAISYASGVGPTASSDLADKEYVLSVVSGGSVTFEKVVVSGTAGETIASGNLVYLKSSDSRWWKTDADTASTVENVMLGIAQGSGTAGASITNGVLTSGTATGLSGLTANTIYYASNTAGGLSSTIGTKEVTAGVALTTTSLLFSPRYNQQLTEDEQDAMAGGGDYGTPSTSNKFVTTTYEALSNNDHLFGNGADGDVVISGNTTLTEDKYYDDLTIDSGFTLDTGGYRIYVKGILTVNGSIARNGGVGTTGDQGTSGGSGGGGGGGGSLADGYTKGSATPGSGGAGGNDDHNGTAGVAGTAVANALDASNGVDGGAGGLGCSTYVGGAGGAGGTTTISTNRFNGFIFTQTILDVSSTGASLKFNSSASSGGGGGGGACGGGDGTGGGGGGGGGSNGGIVGVYAKTIVIGAAGSVTANGGAGGVGGAGLVEGSNGSGGGGGGGGGNGGIVVLMYKSLTNNGSSNITANGGAGGVGGADPGTADSSTGGSTGTTGNAGTVYQFDL